MEMEDYKEKDTDNHFPLSGAHSYDEQHARLVIAY